MIYFLIKQLKDYETETIPVIIKDPMIHAEFRGLNHQFEPVFCLLQMWINSDFKTGSQSMPKGMLHTFKHFCSILFRARDEG
jgi:hypothetical protein